MDNFLELNPDDLRNEWNILYNGLERSNERIRYKMDMIFPACVLRTVEYQLKYFGPINIMSEGFFEVHYPKIIEEYLLYNEKVNQIESMCKLWDLCISRGMIKDEEKFLGFVSIDFQIEKDDKPVIQNYVLPINYIIQLNEELYDKLKI